jgi:hypothetical protein
MLEGRSGLSLDMSAGMNGVGQNARRHNTRFQEITPKAKNNMLPATRDAIWIPIWSRNELVMAVSPSPTKRYILWDSRKRLELIGRSSDQGPN